MPNGVSLLDSEAGLKEREQVEDVVVVGSMAPPAQAHDAVFVVATPDGPGRHMRGIAGLGATDDARSAMRLLPLSLRAWGHLRPNLPR